MPLDHVRCINAVGLAFVLGQHDRVVKLIRRGDEYLTARKNESRQFFDEFAHDIEGRMRQSGRG